MPDSPKKVRALTDANVLLSGTVFPRWPREVLRHALPEISNSFSVRSLSNKRAEI